jgi:spore germination cell wall hydrolase CwlJ-like protein
MKKLLLMAGTVLSIIFIYDLTGQNIQVNELELPKRNSDAGYSHKNAELLSLNYEKELLCLQKNIYFEARNQSNVAKYAVAWVTINRTSSTKYPNTVCSVVKQARLDVNGNPKLNQCKFSWYCDGKSDRPNLDNPIERRAWEVSGQVADKMLRSCYYNHDMCPDDVTNGALYYHAKTVNPYWVSGAILLAEIDDHKFYTMR